ncbi:MAG: lactate racemase domain-containing protein [Gemmatimonadota bacterium]
MPFPRMMRVKQHFDAPTVDDIPAAIRAEIAKLGLSGKVRPGQTVAIAVGSRGIYQIALIIKTVVEEMKALGARPFAVPAMGSHGGGTAEGQRGIIESYGVTEEYIGAPIRSSMEVVQVDQTEDGVPVYFDQHAYGADHVVVVGRIKPHTGFVGEIESGLHKMMLIGLGKHKGAILYHQAIVHYSFDRIIRSVGQSVIEKCRILFGLALVENPYDRTALVRAVPPARFVEEEKELLLLARKWMPRLPFDLVDLLVIDAIGKDISGSGLDTNVVGRKYNSHEALEKEYPKVTRIVVRDLTPATHGNAAGIGIADFCHQRVLDQIDVDATNINCITGNSPSGAQIPIHYDTDARVIATALTTVGLVEDVKAKVVRIHDTLHVEEVMISEAYLPEVEKRDDLEILSPLADMAFDARGDLLPF